MKRDLPECHETAGKPLSEMTLEELRQLFLIIKRGFCHGFHAKVIKPFVVGTQSVFNFPQRILAGNLSKEQSQKLFPCGEMLAISVSA